MPFVLEAVGHSRVILRPAPCTGSYLTAGSFLLAVPASVLASRFLFWSGLAVGESICCELQQRQEELQPDRFCGSVRAELPG